MKKEIAYILHENGKLGCIPQCVLLVLDKDDKPSTEFITISSLNKTKYKQHYDTKDELLINCCFQLEKDEIVKKISQRNIRSWSDLETNYFTTLHQSSNDQYIRNYISDYINGYLNKFFENIEDKALYIPTGKFPFGWKRVHIEIEMPEVFYHIEKDDKGLEFSLEVQLEDSKLNLLNTTLLSRKTARILSGKKIFEFNQDIEGAKLIPFLSKESIRISPDQTKEYLQKIVIPLIPSDHILPVGFDIHKIEEITKIALQVKEIGKEKQTSLFEDSTPETTIINDLVFELFFEYEDFKFWAGNKGLTDKINFTDKNCSILHVERDWQTEKTYINKLKDLGMDFDGKILRLPYIQGINWLNDSVQELEMMNIEIIYKQSKVTGQKVFIGKREMTMIIHEDRDWFDIKGKVLFGTFELPLLLVLQYIKHNKPHIVLPNGEIAIIPKEWFDEFKSIAEYYKIEEGKPIIAKHYASIAKHLTHSKRVTLSIKKNMQRLLENDFTSTFDLPLHFNGSLRNYQQEGYNWLRMLDDLSLGGCLADDMGLGKTIQTLCLLQWMKENKRGTSLLIVPTSLVHNWQREAEQFCPQLKLYVHIGAERSKNSLEIDKYDVIITSYAILRRDKEIFCEPKFNYAILDEAQSIKNPHADIASICLDIKALRFLTLTGTPIENSISDLWSQMHFINRNMLGPIHHFLKESKQEEKLEMYRRLIKPFLLRRKKEKVLPDLPEKSIIVQYCNMTKSQEDIYKETRNTYRDRFLEGQNENKKLNSFLLLEGLQKLRQVANHPSLTEIDYEESSGKFQTVCQMLDDIIKQGDKVLLFSSFLKHLELYKLDLEKKGINYSYLDGSTKDRKAAVDKFQNQDDTSVFLISLKAGGIGLNLTKASYVFLVDPWWNPAAEAQAYDRAHRIGQTKQVFVYKFITQNTIEEKILKLQNEKQALFNDIIENENNLLKDLQIEEILKLIDAN